MTLTVTSCAGTCVQLALQSPLGLAPETVRFHPSAASWEPQFSIVNPGYHLRPEILETLFYLWRATQDEKYRQWGAKIWQAISVACRTPAAYVHSPHFRQLLAAAACIRLCFEVRIMPVQV
jgi:hypothetical protein